MRYFLLATVAMTVAACVAPPPPVNASRDALWARYGHHPLDELLLAWGAPGSETKLTNGSRLVTYRHATTFDAASPYERTNGCEVTFLAPPKAYAIENIAMTGDAYECADLSQKGPGYARNVYVPPPPPPVIYPSASFYYR